MKLLKIPYNQIPTTPRLLTDYYLEDEKLRQFYAFSPDMEGISAAIKARGQYPLNRQVLTEVLLDQYLDYPGKTSLVHRLADPATFTVTTGHQLSLFTGPLYFIYKITSVISYATRLKKAFPRYNFIPVYWMASEDHDFEEISCIHLNKKKFCWESPQQGPVGRFHLHGFEKVLKQVLDECGEGKNAILLKEILEKAYRSKSLAEATRMLVHAVFEETELLVIDGDDPRLKKQFIPVMEADIIHRLPFRYIEDSQKELQKEYKALVNPRPINFFFMENGKRERLEFSRGRYHVLNTDKSFAGEELRKLINDHPEKFSPNVLLRPLYQETILPNLAYFGGPAELAYWLELKAAFDALGVFFPQVLHRNSAIFISRKQLRLIRKLKLQPEQFFFGKDQLVKAFLSDKTGKQLDMQLEELIQHYKSFRDKASDSQLEFRGKYIYFSTRHLKELEKQKQYIRKALKEKHASELQELENLKEELFPSGVMQERVDNFIPLFLKHGHGFQLLLLDSFDALSKDVYMFLED